MQTAGKRLAAYATIVRMPPPDWERADRVRPQADQPGADRGLAHRLSRLPSSHPSAWRSPDREDAEYGEPDPEEWWRPAADPEPNDTEPNDTAPGEADVVPQDYGDDPDAAVRGDDADLDEIAGVPGEARRLAGAVRGGPRSEASARWDELGQPPGRSPYRPWFSAEGAADPWFAVRESD
jgi:hypothetical protein